MVLAKPKYKQENLQPEKYTNKQKDDVPMWCVKMAQTQDKSAKLLGMTIDYDQKWATQLYGKVGMIPSLKQK